MFENNPLLEPRKSFESPKPRDVKVVGVSFPGDLDYPKKLEEAQHLEQPFGYIYCLNLKRRAELALLTWLEVFPDAHEAQALLEDIMLIQDYMFETTTVEQGYAVGEENDRAEEIIANALAITESIESDFGGA
jgi:hypothetical protein